MNIDNTPANALTGEQVKNLTEAFILPTYARYPVAFKSAHGAIFTDFDGREYVDFTSGIGVNSIGSTDEHWIREVTEQVNTLAHSSNLYYTAPGAKLAARLCSRTGMKAAFFGNSGAEGNEGIIKLARKYSHDKYGDGRNIVVTLVDSFHGRTVTTLAATGQDVFHQHFFPFTEGFRYARANDITSVREAIEQGGVCAVLMEPVQGEGGVLPLDKDFAQAVAKLCDEKDILLLLDEVQTGVGRTGRLFGFQNLGIRPDAFSFAKGIAGGLPMGGFLVNEKTYDTFTSGTHGSTFGANPICAAAANAVLDTIDDELLAEVREKGDYIRAKVAEMALPCVTGVRGMGLMLGLALDESVKVGEVVSKLLEGGLMALTAGHNTLRFLPPLTVTKEEIDRALAVLQNVLGK